MYGRGAIRREVHPHTPVVTVNAVQISSNQKYVFVLHDTKVERRTIVTGAELDDGTVFEVRSGLAPGEEVVIAGADGLADGAAVRVSRDVNPYSGAPTAAVAPSEAEVKAGENGTGSKVGKVGKAGKVESIAERTGKQD